MFLVADHFEPVDMATVKEWAKRYRAVARKHRDSDGKFPQHTWFYPIEYWDRFGALSARQVQILCRLSREGFGEIEMQWHHFNDTAETLRIKLRQAKDRYGKMGIFETIEGKKAFGFVHGNWALDNSIIIDGRNYCGVNNELIILKNEGCFADFTFPAFGTIAQPSKINSIYYAIDDPKQPKSYNQGFDVEVAKKQRYDLMIFEGPLVVNLFRQYIDRATIQQTESPSPRRIDSWIKANIHVKGQPQWIFVKVHTHGALPGDKEIWLGHDIDKMFSYLERKYNDGKDYILHYVTAREAYNIVKAAEDGLKGNPNNYRDYKVKPYKYKYSL